MKKSIENQDKKSEMIVIKIEPKHKELLTEYYKNNKGIGLSTGIRQLIFDFMKNNKMI